MFPHEDDEQDDICPVCGDVLISGVCSSCEQDAHLKKRPPVREPKGEGKKNVTRRRTREDTP
jgi:hypothetical protein